VVGQEQFHDLLAGLEDRGGVGMDLHAFGGGIGAGRDQPGHALHFHHAHAAGPGRYQALHVADGRHVDATALERLEDGVPLLQFDLLTVRFNE